MADLTLQVRGIARDGDGKDAVVNVEHANMDGVLAFAKCEGGSTFELRGAIVGGWSTQHFSAVLLWMQKTIGKDRFVRALELMLQRMEEEDGKDGQT